jgi:hypothetical protein
MGAPTNAANVKKVLANSEPSTHGGIVLQNSQNAARQFSRPKMKQATIAH